MNIKLTEKPRVFETKGTTIKDYGKIFLKKNEMISLVLKNGKEFDITAKDWGLYLGPSLNSRLKKQGFKAALVVNEKGQLYLHAVLKEEIKKFKRYLTTNQNNKIICWLDEWFNI